MISLAYVRAFWGSRFDSSALAPQFRGLDGQQVTVRLSSGRTVHGTVSVSGGWQPVYMLLPTETTGKGWIPLIAQDTVTP